jgi:hypothetical protein
MLHVIFAALLLVPATTTPSDPCKAAHRLICGPIRIVPRDPNARRAMIANAVVTLADGIVTSVNTHGNPTLEGDPLVRPFVRGGLPHLLLGWASMEIGHRALAHAFHLSDRRVEDFTIREHVAGIASWLSPRTYAWMPNEWQAYHQPYAEAAWIRYDATLGKY